MRQFLEKQCSEKQQGPVVTYWSSSTRAWMRHQRAEIQTQEVWLRTLTLISRSQNVGLNTLESGMHRCLLNVPHCFGEHEVSRREEKQSWSRNQKTWALALAGTPTCVILWSWERPSPHWASVSPEVYFMITKGLSSSNSPRPKTPATSNRPWLSS